MYLSLLLKLLVVREVHFNVQDVYGFWNFSPRPELNFLQCLKESSNESEKISGKRYWGISTGCLTSLDALQNVY